MARFVRRMRYRRKPVIRRRRRRGIRRAHRRRVPKLSVKLTRTIQLDADGKAENNLSLHCNLNEFAEHINLGANFERVKVWKVKARVYPQQNVANNSTSRVGNYCIVPYHNVMPTTPINFPTALSIDKAKVFRGTQCGRMSFVPVSRLNVDHSTSADATYTVAQWRPTFEISKTASTQWLYNGFLVPEKINQDTASHFTIVLDVFVTYYNQRSFL